MKLTAHPPLCVADSKPRLKKAALINPRPSTRGPLDRTSNDFAPITQESDSATNLGDVPELRRRNEVANLLVQRMHLAALVPSICISRA